MEVLPPGTETWEELFQRLDDPISPEEPQGWDRLAAEEEFVAFASSLSERLGLPLKHETAQYIQDASFHGWIYVPLALLREPEGLAPWQGADVRASNFGRLVTVYPDDAAVIREALASVIAVARDHGYTYVPSGVLNTPYAGRNRGVTGFETWMDRFFDFV